MNPVLQLLFLVVLPALIMDHMVRCVWEPRPFVLKVTRSFVVVTLFAVQFRAHLLAQQYCKYMEILAFVLRLVVCIPLWMCVYLVFYNNWPTVSFVLVYCITLEVLLPWTWFPYFCFDSSS